jgi:hypothetical protein
MREQIETLMKQAGTDTSGKWMGVEHVETLVELIVRECAELTLNHKNDDYYNGWLDYRDEIKRHFGIEQ